MICAKCKQDQPIERFARDGKKRRNRRCEECKRKARNAQRRWRSRGRVCVRCDERRPCPAEITDYPWREDAVCKACKRAKARDFQREWSRMKRVTDPDFKARQIEASMRWQRRHRDAVRASERRRYAAARSDPERWARMMEDARMRYRLRRERQGLPLRVMSAEDYVRRYGTGYGRATTLPTDPLIPMLRERLDQVGELTLAEMAGVSPRRIYEIVNGRSTRVSMVNADKLCVYFETPMSLLYGETGLWTP